MVFVIGYAPTITPFSGTLRMSKSNLDTEQGLLERVFKLKQHGTTARTELIAGITTFLTMVYIVFVNRRFSGLRVWMCRRCS